MTTAGVKGQRSADEDCTMLPTDGRGSLESVTIAGQLEMEDAPYVIAERFSGSFVAAVGRYEGYRDALKS